MGYYLVDFPLINLPRLTHFGHATFTSSHNVDNHCHFGYELVYFYEGSTRLIVNKNGNPVFINKEDLLITAPFVEHKFSINPSNLLISWLGFQTGRQIAKASFSMFPRDLLFNKFQKNDVDLSYTEEKNEDILDNISNELHINDYVIIHKMPEAGEIFLKLKEEILNRREYVKDLIYIKVLELLTTVARKIFESNNNYKCEVIDYVDNYLKLNYKHQVTLENLSKVTGFNPTYLCRKYKAVKGITPLVFLNNFRILKAKEMLSSGNSISDTAYECGFSDVSYFSYFFRQKVGITPTQYLNK
jgi:AraC-like DNA-binding protein